MLLLLLLAVPVVAPLSGVLPGNMTDDALEMRVRDFFCTPHADKAEFRVLGFHNGLEVIVEVRPDRTKKEPPFAIVHYRKNAGAECTAAGGVDFFAGFPTRGAYSGIPVTKYCGAKVLVEKKLGNYWLLSPNAPLPDACRK